jgi:hypothetical protein
VLQQQQGTQMGQQPNVDYAALIMEMQRLQNQAAVAQAQQNMVAANALKMQNIQNMQNMGRFSAAQNNQVQLTQEAKPWAPRVTVEGALKAPSTHLPSF